MEIYFNDKEDDELYHMIRTEIATDNKKYWRQIFTFTDSQKQKEDIMDIKQL